MRNKSILLYIVIRRFLRGILLVSIFPIFAITNVLADTWKTENIGGYSVRNDNIAVDTNNRLHIVYDGYPLYYMYYDGSLWHSETIDSLSSDVKFKVVSTKIDSSGKIHVFYEYEVSEDYNEKELKYATNASGSWITTTIGSYKNYKVLYTFLDTSNKAHIIFEVGYYGSFIMYATNASGTWITTTIIDGDNEYTDYHSIAVDKSGKIHIVYIKQTSGSLCTMKYITNSSGSWETTTVDGGNKNKYYASSTSIEVDTFGKVHISYSVSDSSSRSDEGLRYATNESGTWTTETVDWLGGVPYRIVANTSGKVYIIYYYIYGESDLIKYATNTFGTWTTKTVASDVGDHSVAVETAGNVHAIYSDNNKKYLYYTTNASGTWTRATIDQNDVEEGGEENIDKYYKTLFDSSFKAHVIYYDTLIKNLKYITNASGSWITEEVDSDCENVYSRAVDASDKLHVIYSKSKDSGDDMPLKYATNTSGTWVSATLRNDGGLSSSSSFDTAFDTANKLHICWIGYDGYLKYITPSDLFGIWKVTIVDSNLYSSVVGYSNTSVGNGDGFKTSLALDKSNNAHISYYDGTNGDLKYATNVSGSWVTITVDSSGNVGLYNSIALDKNGKVHISYYDSTNSRLKYTTNTSGSWVTTVLASNNDSDLKIGQYSSIAVDSSGKAHISYYDDSTGSLKYATNASGLWVKKTIDGGSYYTEAGRYTSIAVDKSDKVHISYRSSALKYATNTSGSWVADTLDSDYHTGYYTSITVDNSNKVHISYCTVSNYGRNTNLNYAANSTGKWVSEEIDSSGGEGSIVLDLSGNVYIVYSGEYGLKYVTNATQTSSTPTPTPTPSSTHTPSPKPTSTQTCSSDGDVNEDGKLTAKDALLAFQYILNKTTLTSCQQSHAGVNGDGKITASDVRCTFKAVLNGLSTSESLNCE